MGKGNEYTLLVLELEMYDQLVENMNALQRGNSMLTFPYSNPF